MIPFDSHTFFNDASYFDRGIYLNDGTFVPMFNAEEDMSNLLNERLGLDAELTFKAIVYENKHEVDAGDDYELIADEYLQELNHAINELDFICQDLSEELSESRLNRKHLQEILDSLRNLSADLFANV